MSKITSIQYYIQSTQATRSRLGFNQLHLKYKYYLKQNNSRRAAADFLLLYNFTVSVWEDFET